MSHLYVLSDWCFRLFLVSIVVWVLHGLTGCFVSDQVGWKKRKCSFLSGVGGLLAALFVICLIRTYAGSEILWKELQEVSRPMMVLFCAFFATELFFYLSYKTPEPLLMKYAVPIISIIFWTLLLPLLNGESRFSDDLFLTSHHVPADYDEFNRSFWISAGRNFCMITVFLFLIGSLAVDDLDRIIQIFSWWGGHSSHRFRENGFMHLGEGFHSTRNRDLWKALVQILILFGVLLIWFYAFQDLNAGARFVKDMLWAVTAGYLVVIIFRVILPVLNWIHHQTIRMKVSFLFRLSLLGGALDTVYLNRMTEIPVSAHLDPAVIGGITDRNTGMLEFLASVIFIPVFLKWMEDFFAPDRKSSEPDREPETPETVSTEK